VVEVISLEFGIGPPAVSMQLKVLRESGFASVRPDGPRRLYAVSSAPLQGVVAWLRPCRAVWEQRLDALGTEIARGRRAGSTES
jgi:DNA-binding transcriptional ArsR family regulator